jgi:hypothetical protein
LGTFFTRWRWSDRPSRWRSEPADAAGRSYGGGP